MKRGLAVILSSLLLISMFVVIASFPKAYAGAFPGENGKIAFHSNRNGNTYQVYVINADGSGQTNLSNNDAIDRWPSWSPDGTKIAFTSTQNRVSQQVYVMNADGSGQTNLSNNDESDSEPSWSPDGTKIAFTRTTGIHQQVFVMNADGTGQTNLSNNDATDDNEPSWSPDGTKIAFTRFFRTPDFEVFAMNADGTGQTNLSNNDEVVDFGPSWSPDGTKIAFTSTQNRVSQQVYVMNADGSGQTNLSNNLESDVDVNWSPDGTKIAFTSFRDHVSQQVYVMNADGSRQTRLTDNDAGKEFPINDFPDWQSLPGPSGENALIADNGVISLGETTKLIQKIDASSGITGTLISLLVLEADGDTCAANGLPAIIPASGILTKEYPTDFSLDTAGGDGACNTAQLGVYKATSEVEVGGVISKSTVEFSTNFFVIPESPVGAAALIGSSLAALGAYMKFKPKSS